MLGGVCFNWIWSPIAYGIGGLVGCFLPVVGVVIFGALILFYWRPIPERSPAGAKTGNSR